MAENNPVANTNPNPPAPAVEPQAPNYDEIFTKLDAILDKRSEGLAKSALRDNGVDDSEISEIVKAYKENKKNQKTEQSNALIDAQKQVEELQRQLSERDISDAMTAVALNDLGLSANTIPYVTRLADRSDVLGSDGKPSAEKIKASLDKVLADIPALKASVNDGKGFVTVGAKTGTGSTEPEADTKLRSFFGLK